MSGCTFVVGQGVHDVFLHCIHVFLVNVIDTRSRAIGRWPVIKRRRCAIFTPGLDPPDFQRCFRQYIEIIIGDVVNTIDQCSRILNIFLSSGFGVFVVVLRTVTHIFKKSSEIPIKSNFKHDSLHFNTNAINFCKPQLMEFIDRSLQGGPVLNSIGVKSPAIG